MPEEIDLTHDRVTRENAQHMLFDLPPDWREVWWGMPDFAMEDARAQRRIVVNFMCEEDVTAFTEATGARITDRTESMWYPPQKALGYEYEYDGPKTDSIYPICIPSKGRADVQKTGRALKRMGVNYRFFVEQTEAEEYAKHVGEEHVVSMPFNDLGKGSIPARNFIWLWALEQGYKRHWTVDDNIISFVRTHANRRLCVRWQDRMIAGSFLIESRTRCRICSTAESIRASYWTPRWQPGGVADTTRTRTCRYVS